MSQRAAIAGSLDGVHEEVRPAWLARAIVSGFAASVMLLFAYLVAFGFALALARVQWSNLRGGSDLGTAFQNLVNNPVVGLAQSNLYVALAVYLAGGLIWAAFYARYVEPRLAGPHWLKGIYFSVVPFLVSILVVLPLLGGGILGLALGAGPLPVIGNALLHILYGAVLGMVYGPFGDTIQVADAAEIDGSLDRRSMVSSERTAARWLIGGLIAGLVIGALLAFLLNLDGPGGVFSTASLAFMVATALIVGAFGALVGSFAGLSVAHEPH